MTFSFNSLHIRRLWAFKHITIVSVVACIVYEKLLINIFHTIARHFFPGEINILYLTVEEFFWPEYILIFLVPDYEQPPIFSQPAKRNTRKKKGHACDERNETGSSLRKFTFATILNMELVLPDMWWSTFNIDTVMLRSILERAPAKTTVIICEQKP